jgi:hypothetical protein
MSQTVTKLSATNVGLNLVCHLFRAEILDPTRNEVKIGILKLVDIKIEHLKLCIKVKLSLQQAVETSRLQHFLDNRGTDGGEVASLTRPAALYPKEDPWYSFLLEAESIPGSQCGWKD